jgi:hypothetical protein
MQPTYVVSETGKRPLTWPQLIPIVLKYAVMAALLVYLLLLMLWAARIDGYLN